MGVCGFAARFAGHFAAAKSSANLEIEIEIENESENITKERGYGGRKTAAGNSQQTGGYRGNKYFI